FSWSTIFRQSRYRLAYGNFWNVSEARRSSQSHSATMLTAPVSMRSWMSSAPRPPEPTAATLSVSLAETLRREGTDCSTARTVPGAAPDASHAAPAREPWMNRRREVEGDEVVEVGLGRFMAGIVAPPPPLRQ